MSSPAIANSLRPRAPQYRRGSDSVEQLQPVSKCCDAKLFQVLVRQTRKNRLVYLVLAECCLILFEAKAPQPTRKVHDGALNGLPLMIVQPSRRVQRDELTPIHSMTSSARASRVSGTSSPSVLAALRLIARSNLVGCSMGSSVGLTPLRILST
jgi:hypothetical protein